MSWSSSRAKENNEKFMAVAPGVLFRSAILTNFASSGMSLHSGSSAREEAASGEYWLFSILVGESVCREGEEFGLCSLVSCEECDSEASVGLKSRLSVGLSGSAPRDDETLGGREGL